MKTNFFLTVNKNGSVKITRKPTHTDFGEVSIGLTLELPDVLFKRPHIQAKIQINNDAVQPFLIDADTENLVKNAIQQSTGFEVKLSIVNPE